MWKRKTERLPWYRAGDPKSHIIIGNIPEAVKRQLDAFRMQPKHPAAHQDDLPEEVQSYIGSIEMELYDKKQEAAVTQAMFGSVVGAGLLFANYKGWLPSISSFWSYVGAVLLLVVPWIWYWREWHKNAEEFTPEDYHPTDEAIRREWEIKYLARSRRAERDASSGG